MVEIVAATLSLAAFITGYFILLKHRWDFCIKHLWRDKEAFIYLVVCLSTAASFGAFWLGLGTSPNTLAHWAMAVNKILGLISIIGFHILCQRILEDKK